MLLRHKRLLAVTVSTLVGLAIATAAWKLRPEGATVETHDNREEYEGLIEKRTQGEASVATMASPGGSEAARALDEPLRRGPIPEKDARVLFSALRQGGKRTIYDPQAYYWEASSFRSPKTFAEHPSGSWNVRTNDMGFRKSVDVLQEKPDLRIIATGDSHTAGVIPNREQFVNALERLLEEVAPTKSIEGLNAGKGAYSFYNYVGALEKVLPLEPDVFVMAVFGGNDFFECVRVYRYFNQLRSAPKAPGFKRKTFESLREESRKLFAQGMNQIGTFREFPIYREYGLVVARRSATAVREICDENGIRLVCVYIPPCADAQPHLIRDQLDRVIEGMAWTESDVHDTDRIADEYLGFLEESGIAAIDMRDIYRQSSKACYWMTDLHINTEGHRLIAVALAEELRALLGG